MGVLLSLFFITSFSQEVVNVSVTQPFSLQSDAGTDTFIYKGESTPIGGNPTAIKGTLPYSYSWTPVASLDDATIANPTATPDVTTVYTVLVTDINGCTSTDSIKVKSVPTSIFNSVNDLSFKIFPNPSYGIFNIAIQGYLNDTELNIEVYNALGKTVYYKKIGKIKYRYQGKIDLNNESAGIYIVKLKGSESSVFKRISIK